LAKKGIFIFAVVAAVCFNSLGGSVQVVLNEESFAQTFGGERVLEALKSAGDPAQFIKPSTATGDEAVRVLLLPDGTNQGLLEAGFSFAKTANGIEVRAVDEIGAMYGLLELADMITIHGLDNVPEKTVNPRFPFRAIKFNLPWSSYRQDEVLQPIHYDTVRDIKFWRAYLDMMAENRFNALTLWSLHPFPYMIRPTNYPEACPFDDAELAEWQTFWHALFKEAKNTIQLSAGRPLARLDHLNLIGE
jgi:hypothetical protein